MSQGFVNAHGRGGEDAPQEETANAQVFASAQGADDLLDEIDQVLEENSEVFVRSFVQKGGQ